MQQKRNNNRKYTVKLHTVNLYTVKSSFGAHAPKNRRSFVEDLFFGDHLISARKTVQISSKTLISVGKTVKILSKTFFFWRSLNFWTKQQHFLLLFWTSQNQNSITFELSPGPRLALGAPDRTNRHILEQIDQSCKRVD